MLKFSYDEHLDVMTIEGIKYSGQLFKDFARDLPEGQYFKFNSRKDGVVEIIKYWPKEE